MIGYLGVDVRNLVALATTKPNPWGVSAGVASSGAASAPAAPSQAGGATAAPTYAALPPMPVKTTTPAGMSTGTIVAIAGAAGLGLLVIAIVATKK